MRTTVNVNVTKAKVRNTVLYLMVHNDNRSYKQIIAAPTLQRCVLLISRNFTSKNWTLVELFITGTEPLAI